MKIPTIKQIHYAKYLSERVGRDMPEEFTAEAYARFIGRWKPVVMQEDADMNEPSAWQLQYD